MATITTTAVITRHYEFCDEIFQHILSYIPKPKPMKLLELHTIEDLLYAVRWKTPKQLIYEFRMLVSWEQYEYEKSMVGRLHRVKDLAERKHQANKSLIIQDLRNYWSKKQNGMRRILNSEYNLYMCAWYNPYWKILDRIYKNEKRLLGDICEYGKEYSEREAKREQQRRRKLRPVSEASKAKAKLARSRIVECEDCLKSMTFGSLTRHQKKCNAVA